MTKADYKKSGCDVSIFDDKKFVIKFSFLLILIVVLSILGITQNKEIAFIEAIKSSTIKFQSLKSIEEKLSGKSVNLSVTKSDLNSLSELDLSNIELMTDVEEPIETQNNSVVNKKERVNITDGSLQTKVPDKKRIIITSEQISSIGSMKKRFHKSNNIDDALLISKKFFQKKEYKRSLKWSLIANEIDKSNETSWVMFAKSKIKLGKKRDAISALSAYLKDHKSAKVKALLDDIESNS